MTKNKFEFIKNDLLLCIFLFHNRTRLWRIYQAVQRYVDGHESMNEIAKVFLGLSIIGSKQTVKEKPQTFLEESQADVMKSWSFPKFSRSLVLLYNYYRNYKK